MVRPYIQDRDVKLEEKILSILETQKGPWTGEVTNVTGSHIEEEKTKEEKYAVKDTTSSTVKHHNKDSEDILNCSQNVVNLKYEDFSTLYTPSPKIMVNNEKNSINHADLSTVGLPLTLHHKDDNLLVAAVMQDLDKMYKNTANMVDRCFLSAHQQGLICYSTLKIILQDTGRIKNLLYNNTAVIANLAKRSDIWLTDSKPATNPVTPAKDDKVNDQAESPIDKIKKLIENAINSIKQKVEEKKKSMEEKK